MNRLDGMILTTIEEGEGVPLEPHLVEIDLMTRTAEENVAAVPRMETTSDLRLLLDLLVTLKPHGVPKGVCILLEILVVGALILREDHDSLGAIKVVRAEAAIAAVVVVAAAVVELTGWKGEHHLASVTINSAY